MIYLSRFAVVFDQLVIPTACYLGLIALSSTNQNRVILSSILQYLIFFFFFFLQQLLEAVIREDLPQCILLLAHCSPEDLNTAYEDRESCTALHISCSLGNIVITQLLIWVRFKLRVYILPNVSHTLYISPY